MTWVSDRALCHVYHDFGTSILPLCWAAGVVCEELLPMGWTHAGEVHGGQLPVGGSLCWSRGWSPPPEEERATETICEGLTTSFIPCLPAQLREEKIEKNRSEIELGQREQCREVILRFGFTSLFYSDLTGNKLN